MTEREKMEQGIWYDANFDTDLVSERLLAKTRCHEFSLVPPNEPERGMRILMELLGSIDTTVVILAPFYVDYGRYCHFGPHTFINHACYFMDAAPITLGSFCNIGPSCGFYTSTHPLVAEERRTGLEQGQPITLEDDVWLGAGVKVMPGVRIGRGSVVGAGSVVTRDVPAGVLAYGDPCRVIREISDADRITGSTACQIVGGRTGLAACQTVGGRTDDRPTCAEERPTGDPVLDPERSGDHRA